jgi:hypothetical protein
VQKDERGGYDRASLARLRRVAGALGLRLTGQAVLPRRPGLAPSTGSGRAVSRCGAAGSSTFPSSHAPIRPVRPPQPALEWELPPLSGTTSDPALNVDLRVSVSPC